MGSQQSSNIAEQPEQFATTLHNAGSGSSTSLHHELPAEADYRQNSIQSFEPFAELTGTSTARETYEEPSGSPEEQRHDETTLQTLDLLALKDSKAPEPLPSVTGNSSLQPFLDASRVEAEVMVWRHYIRCARRVNTDRVDAREKRKVWRNSLENLKSQNNQFSRDLRRFQDLGFTDPRLSKKLLRSSHNLRKAQEELDASENAMEEAETALTQAEYDLERDAPVFLAPEHDPEESYSLLKGRGFDFSGYQSEALGTVVVSNDFESSYSSSDPVIMSTLDRIASIEQRILSIRLETAAISERNVLLPQSSPGDDARLDAYDEQVTRLTDQLHDSMAELETHRDSQTLEDSNLETSRVSESPYSSTQVISEAKPLIEWDSSYTSTFVRAIVSVPSYRALATHVEALRPRDQSLNSQDFVNCWLLYQLGSDPIEVDRYLACVGHSFSTSIYDIKSARAINRDAITISDQPDKERPETSSLDLHADQLTSADSEGKPPEAAGGPGELADSLVQSLGSYHFTRLWFQDGTSAHIPQLPAPVETTRGMSTHANAGGSHGVFSESVSNLSRGPLPASRNAPTFLRMSPLASETPPSPPLSTRGVTANESVE